MLSAAEQKLLDAQRFDHPLRQALCDSLAALGANPSAVSIDAAAIDGYDLQTRSAFALAGPLKIKPEQAAIRLADELNARLNGWATCASSQGTGFINIALSDKALLDFALSGASPFPSTPWLRALVDYSSPNCAKRMHVGHLRSSVIGDALCRIMEACGSDVERVNHLGDWGTPFGIIIEQAQSEGVVLESASLEDIEGIYQRGSALMGLAAKADASSADQAQSLAFAQRARETTALMQARKAPAYQAWKSIRSSTVAQLQDTYDLLGIGLKPHHAVGESDYQDEAGPLIADMVARGLCEKGPQGVAYLGHKQPLPLEKSQGNGGGLLYGGTDLAALARRGSTGRKLLYVTDERQAGHFAALFDLGEKSGLCAKGQAMHVPFGMMLAPDGSPFKSRTGGAMPLNELIDDALASARSTALAKYPEIDEQRLSTLSRELGIGALKYGDLSRNRTSSVKFDIQQAVSMVGDTAPYLQYARVRAKSAMALAQGLPASPAIDRLLEPQERKLCLALCRLRDYSCEALSLLEPHRICSGLYEAASAFGSFYESCPCIKDGHADPMRLALMTSFMDSMSHGLAAIGLGLVDSMPKPKLAKAPH